ncbi:MAG: DNA polymerase I [Phycisphaeraceae bacterium]|nr:MAG: DNA polymerase I [Phycisphaeraceae bacterium]
MTPTPTPTPTATPPSRPTPTLYLIDGYAQFFRAYHAIRSELSSPVTKERTNMTFGFVGMLLKLLRGEGNLGGPPAYLAVALDVSGDRGTFRSQIYPDYKAHRPPPPEDLPPQVDRCLAILAEIGVPTLGAEGFEADDVIATVVRRLRRDHPGVRVRIVSKDKDLKQLLEPGAVELYDIHHDQAITADTLRDELGLSPAQVRDMLTLMGDTVDNVPGVPGVGEKTAAALVRDYGSLEGVLAHAADIKGKRGENIRAWAPEAPLTRSLITLRDDVPIALDLELARADRLRLDRLIPLCQTLGFNRFQNEVRALLGDPAVPQTDPRSAAGGAAATDPMPEAASESKRARDETGRKPAAHARGPEIPAAESLFGGSPAHAASTDRPALGDYRLITSRDQLDALVRALAHAEIIALDTETTELSPMRAKLCGISLSTKVGTGVYIPVRSPDPGSHLDEPTVLDALRPVLEAQHPPKCGHNIKYDLLIFRNAGVSLGGVAFDSMVASYLIDASRSSHGLEYLSEALLGRGKQHISELIGSGKDQRSFDTVPAAAALNYAAADADLTLHLREVMRPQLRSMGLDNLFENVEMPLIEVLAEMEFNGVIVDGEELERQRRRLQSKINDLLDRLDAEAKKSIARTFDPNSPKQLAAALFNRPDDPTPGLGLTPTKKTKTGFSTDAEVLEELGQDATITTPIPALILEYRQFSKLVSTYLVALREAINPATGRVHTSFHQTVAATGRLASSDPNLQNIPIRTDVGREIRKAFVAPPGSVLITADYSQIELRLLAHLSRDPNLIAAFLAGEDIHRQVAAQINNVPPAEVTREMRSGAKMVNFGIVYGITAFGLARRLGVSNAAADEIITGYKRRFAGITTFLHECVEQARRHGYVETILKRRRPIPDIDSSNPSRRAFAERTAINSVVQGSAADLIKIAMVDIHGAIRGAHDRPPDPDLAPARLLLQVHDELVLECPEPAAERAANAVSRRMEGALTLTVPIKVDVSTGRDWYKEG